jgi:hypothetical protein
LRIYLDLLRSELQAMTAFEPSIAPRVLQQCKSGREIRGKLLPLVPLAKALTGFNRLARCSMMPASGG